MLPSQRPGRRVSHREADESMLVRNAVLEAISGAAPERREAIRKLFDEIDPYFARVADSAGFKIEAGAFGSVVVTQRTLDQIWILGHVAWGSLAAYAPTLLLQDGSMDVGSSIIDGQHGQQAEEDAIAQGLSAVKRLNELPAADDFDWPAAVPRPSPLGAGPVQERAISDLNVIAVAYVFLHELHHLECRRGEVSFASPLEEELACDNFATSFLLDAVDPYVALSGEDRTAVLGKRGAGIALGGFILLQMTHRSRWAGSPTHPSLAERLRLLTSRVDVPGDGFYWGYLAALLLSVLRVDGSLPSSVPAADWRDACSKLIDVIAIIA